MPVTLATEKRVYIPTQAQRRDFLGLVSRKGGHHEC
jgi:hypothetical protein